jgi:hypothetical protein
MPSPVSFPDYSEGFLPFFLLDAYLYEQDIGNYGYYTDIIMTEQLLFCDNNMTILTDGTSLLRHYLPQILFGQLFRPQNR